jgi:hypothetical protein
MRSVRSLAAAVLLLAVAGGGSEARAGDAHVTFIAPEHFTDANLNSDRPAKANAPALRELAGHIEHMARNGLPDGQRLDVEITDIDLAGRFEPWRLEARDVRVVTPVTWPRIALRYRLQEGGRTISTGEDELRDQAFDMRPGRLRSGDRLFSEKAMLDDWFQTRFPGRRG